MRYTVEIPISVSVPSDDYPPASGIVEFRHTGRINFSIEADDEVSAAHALGESILNSEGISGATFDVEITDDNGRRL